MHAGNDAEPTSQTEPHRIAAEGVTKIDLRAVLGDTAEVILDAWVLRENTYALLLGTEEDEVYEVILLNTQNGSLLSRTSIPDTGCSFVYARPGWVDGVLHIMFCDWAEWEAEEAYPGHIYIKASLSPDATVHVSDVMSSWYTVMPGGTTAIREAEDGSLYAVDIVTNTEELLIQGVSAQAFFNHTPEERGQYIPSKEELPDAKGDTDDAYLVYDPEDHLTSIRDFSYITPLDEHRFAYGIGAWEWEAGFGVYDLRTRTDHRITSDGYFLGVAGGFIFGSDLKADANTYETFALPESLHPVLEYVYAIENDYLTHSISPDGKLLALTGRYFYPDYTAMEHTVTIIGMETGEIVKIYDIENPFAEASSIAFYDNTHVMLFFGAKENGSAYIYLIDIEE